MLRNQFPDVFGKRSLKMVGAKKQKACGMKGEKGKSAKKPAKKPAKKMKMKY